MRSAGLEDVPPVPPIPIPTSLANMTPGLSSRSPGIGSNGTPSSEARVMAMAYHEITAMLGIKAEELLPPIETRPRSMSAAMESPGVLQLSARSLVRHNSEIVTPRSRASDSFPTRRRSRSIDERTAMLAATITGLTSP
ncbi:hypothetical protein NM688_g1682 [Phlebia brevispora]|uniref:Uncharacterized protein n=1 Tax=Phlebia brevispora TaxID=194682 RepID=A0ACC1TAT3_9APHY|nr:hypothetical protein NM688_g1682 [Phlebia brevispora]